MLQRIFGKEVASLEAIGFYRTKDNIFSFDVLLCKEQGFSFLSKHEDYKDRSFTKLSDTYYGVDDIGIELYNEYKESISKIEEVLKEVNNFYSQEEAIASRTYNTMDNFYLPYKHLEDIVPKDKLEWISNIATTDHYAYVDDIKYYLNKANIDLLGVFTKPFENAFKPKDDIRFIINPIPLDKGFGYECIIFIGSKFKGKLMFMSLTINLSEVKGIEVDSL